eukprot:1667083-Amphidinium_carterae.1
MVVALVVFAAVQKCLTRKTQFIWVVFSFQGYFVRLGTPCGIVVCRGQRFQTPLYGMRMRSVWTGGLESQLATMSVRPVAGFKDGHLHLGTSRCNKTIVESLGDVSSLIELDLITPLAKYMHIRASSSCSVTGIL